MALEIVWTSKASLSFEGNIQYLRENWSDKEIGDFVSETFSVIDQVSKMPEMFPASKSKKVRKAVITPHTTLFYRIKKKKVELIFFWDNRMNPEKRSF